MSLEDQEERIRRLLEEAESESDFSDGSDDLYEPQNSSDCETECATEASDEESSEESTEVTRRWTDLVVGFEKKFEITTSSGEAPMNSIPATSTILQTFRHLFPYGLLIKITQHTNERIIIYNNSWEKNLRTKKRTHKLAQVGEIEKVLGILLVMSYNRLPNMRCYWSDNPSMANKFVKSAMGRDRALFLLSKLYFTVPDGEKRSKTYYIDEVVECLKHTFQSARKDSVFQSIDESMTKFKGRSSLKQYMPLKPVKRGIKTWQRCDPCSGYTYDLNIYSGKEAINTASTLGERVVNKLVDTTRTKDVTFCFDRFFTSVSLLENLKYPAVGTVQTNRKFLPKFEDDNQKPIKLNPGDSCLRVSNTGLLFTQWKDTKDVFILSNCHDPELGTVQKKTKTGEIIVRPCPRAIIDYRRIMGGVDRADQMSMYYEPDRKSTKWWIKIFYRLFMLSVTNSWVIYCDNRGKKIPYHNFVVEIAEQLVQHGIRISKPPESDEEPPNKKKKTSQHFIKLGRTRRRCNYCSKIGIEKRTKYLCDACDVSLCVECFEPYHTKKVT